MPFPLPLATFEHYMLADDRIDYPMTFFLRLGFQGRFERERFQAALKASLQWHPLLNAVLRGSVENRTANIIWEDAAPVQPTVVWLEGNAPLEFPRGLHINLYEEPGLRLWLRERPEADTTVLVAQIHHSCCDGLGTMQFMETLLLCYARNQFDSPPESWHVAHEIRHQVKGPPKSANWRQSLSRVSQGVSRIWRFLKTKAVPLVAAPHCGRSSRPEAAGWPALVSHGLDAATTQTLLASAKQQGVSLNALLMRDLMLTLDDWNQIHSVDHSRRVLRIVVPVNLRDQPPREMPSFNAVSMAFVDRTPAQLDDVETLLKGIDAEMDETKTLRRGMALIPVLAAMGSIPQGLSLPFKMSFCLGTAVLSNLGNVFADTGLDEVDGKLAADNMRLESVELAPPVRIQTNISLAVMTYSGVLTICLCYDVNVLTTADAREILEAYSNRLCASR